MERVEVRHKPVHDPVADLPMVDAYLLWALQAAEQVIGTQGLTTILRRSGLEKLINNYPPESPVPSGQFTFDDYGTLCAGLIDVYGYSGKSMMLRIGRLSAKLAVLKQRELFDLAKLESARELPLELNLRAGLEVLQTGYQALMPHMRYRLEDHGAAWAYITETCPMCAGQQATQAMCWLFSGVLQEAAHWQTGRLFEVQEVACRALGDVACVWEISKQPLE
jgi:predicted hydrocarbon binding protein